MTQAERNEQTCEQFRSALVELLQEKPIARISVRELSEKTNLHRGTFYLHYTDIYALQEDLENKVLEEFRKTLEAHSPEEMAKDILPLIEAVFRFFEEHRQYLTAVMSEHLTIYNRVIEVLRQKCYEDWDHILAHPNKENYGPYFDYLAAGSVGLLTHWLENPERPAEEMAQLTKTLILSGFGVLRT